MPMVRIPMALAFLGATACTSAAGDGYERALSDALIEPTSAHSDVLRNDLATIVDASSRPPAGVRASYALQLWLVGEVDAAIGQLEEERAAYPEAARFADALERELRRTTPPARDG